jgi:hypothetical protein
MVGELRKIGLIVFAFSILLLVKPVSAQQLIFYDDFTRDVFNPWSAWGEVDITAGVVYFHSTGGGNNFTASISRSFTPLGDFEYYFRIVPCGTGLWCSPIFRTIFNDTEGGSLEFIFDNWNVPNWMPTIAIKYNGVQYNSTVIPIVYYQMTPDKKFIVKIVRRGNYVEFTWFNETDDSVIASVSYNLPSILIYNITSVKHLVGGNSNTYFDDATLISGRSTPNWGFENDVIENIYKASYMTSNWCLYNESLAYRTMEDKTEGMYSFKIQNCSTSNVCELVKPIGFGLNPNYTYKLSFDIKKMGNLNRSIYFGIAGKNCYNRADCFWKRSTYPYCVNYQYLFSLTDSDIPNTNQWYHIERTITTGTCYDETRSPCWYPNPYNISADKILLIDFFIDPVPVYLDNFNIVPTGAPSPPQHVSVTKYCEFWGNPGEIYGWFPCSPADIDIPSNAVNVTSYTSTRMIVYNATWEGNASCNFTIQSCNYPLGYSERCGYTQVACTGATYSTPYIYYGTIFGGQTVKSSGSVTVPEGCVIAPPGGAPSVRIKVEVSTHVGYDLVTLPPTKSATLYVEPKTGNKTTIFYFHLLTSNLAKPYNASLYIDGRWQATHYNIYDDTLTVEMAFGDNTGSHTIYFVVRDSDGTEITTNTEEVYVGAGGIQPFTLTVIPTQGDVFTSFSFQTSEIRGGTAPYTVELYHGASIFVGKCEGVPEGGTCSKSVLLPCGYRNAFAIAKDSAGNQMVSNFVSVNVTCAPMGETLNVTLTMTPTTGNSQTIFNLTFTIRGGAPPYRVTWLEWGNPLCSDEIYTSSPPFSVTERWKFPAGSRGISLSVRSADGQVAPSNLLTFDVAWAGETNFTSYDCTGTLGAWTQRGAEVPPAPYVPSYEPVINRTLFTQAGADWLAFFFTPMFFATLMLVGIAGFITLAIAKYGGGQFAPAVFIVISMVMLAIYGMSGIYPPWLVIVLIILAGFVFAKFVLGVI